MKRRKLEPIIVETSLELFKSKGYDNVSVVEICNACDITKPTFYKYATSKGDLLRFYFKRIPETFDPNWNDPASYSSCWEGISQVLLKFLHNFMAYGLDLCTQLYIQNIQSYSDTFTAPDGFLEDLANMIQLAQSNGEIKNLSDPMTLAQTCMSLMIGYGGYWVLFNGQKDAEKEFLEALAVLLQAPVPTGKE